MDPSNVQRIMAEAATRTMVAAMTRQAKARGPPHYEPVGEGFPFDPNYVHVDHAFMGVFPFLGRVFKTLAIGSLLLAVSAGSYALFYQAVMPSLSAAHPLFFDYTGPLNPSFLGKPNPPPLDYTEAFTSTFYGSLYNNHNKDKRLEPWAVANLFARHSSWEALQSDVLPMPVAEHRLLKAKQPYFIEVVLTLPDSNLNREPGMFGVVTELYSHNGTQLAVSRRSTRFPHQSHWITVVRKIFCLIPLLLGAVDEARTVVVPSFRHFVESSGHPLVSVVYHTIVGLERELFDPNVWKVHWRVCPILIIIIFTLLLVLHMQQHALVKIILPTTSQGTQNHHHQVVEITGGDLLIGKELNALQEMLKVWFYTCYLIGTLIFAGFYVVQWSLVRIIWQELRRRSFQEEEPTMSFNFDLDDADLDDSMFEDIDLTMDEEPPAEQDGGGSRRERPVQREWSETEEEAWEDLFYPASMDDASPQPRPVSPTSS